MKFHRAKYLLCFLLEAPRFVFGSATPPEQLTILRAYKQVVSGHVFYVCRGTDEGGKERSIVTDRPMRDGDVVYFEDASDAAFSRFARIVDSPETR